MNIQITSRKFTAKESLKNLINRELNSLTRYYDEIHDANVVLSFTHLKDSIKTAEIVLKVPGKLFTVSESSDEFEKAVKMGTGKLERQLKEFKAKQRNRKPNENN